MSKDIRNMIDKVKNFKQFVNENIEFNETKPEYYLRHYKDDETFSSINNVTKEKTNYNGKQYKELFMYWYNKILPFLENNDENSVLEVLLDWDEETLAKFDMYSMVRKYFKSKGDF
jgi:hypothetical protein